MARIKETDDTQETIELLEAIESQAKVCRTLAQKVEVSKERLKDDKADLDEAQSQLTHLCLQCDEENPLFDGETDAE